MTTEQAEHDRDAVGSLRWLMRTEGHLTFADRFSLVIGAFSTLSEGIRLARRAKRDERRNVDLARFSLPDTPMVRASRQYLEAHSDRSMIHHCFRTAFWTLAVLYQHIELTAEHLETAWVAAL